MYLLNDSRVHFVTSNSTVVRCGICKHKKEGIAQSAQHEETPFDASCGGKTG